MYDKPTVNVSNRLFDEMYDEVLTNFRAAPAEMRSAVEPTAVAGPGGFAKVVWPTSSALSVTLARIMYFVKTTKDGEQNTAPPGAVVRAVLEQWKADNADLALTAVKKFYAGGSL